MSRTAVAVLTLAISVLAGCSSDSPERPEATVPSGAPAAGEQITTDEFSFNAPEGWTSDDGSAAPAFNFAALAIDKGDKDGFADNLNVLEDPTLGSAKDFDELNDFVRRGLVAYNGDVEIADPIRIDGEDTIVVTGILEQGAIKYRVVQYAVVHDGDGYFITFSYSPDRPESECQSIAESVATSWKWTA